MDYGVPSKRKSGEIRRAKKLKVVEPTTKKQKVKENEYGSASYKASLANFIAEMKEHVRGKSPPYIGSNPVPLNSTKCPDRYELAHLAIADYNSRKNMKLKVMDVKQMERASFARGHIYNLTLSAAADECSTPITFLGNVFVYNDPEMGKEVQFCHPENIDILS